jgi:hypothetical protein
MPMDGRPEKLREPVLELRERMRAAGRPAPEVVPLTSLPFEDPGAARSRLAALGELGVTGVVHAAKYDTEDEFARQVDALVAAGEGLRT